MYLVVDASCAEGFAALVCLQDTLARVDFVGGRARDCAAAQAISAIISEHPDTNIEGVVVGIGPGSYNGLRSSLAATWGFAFARRLPLAGVASWLALGEGDYAVVSDARQNHFAFAQVSNGAFLNGEPHLLTRKEALATIESLDSSLPLLCPAPCGLPREVSATVRPELLVRVALQQGIFFDAPIPTPLYLKPPYITQATGQ